MFWFILMGKYLPFLVSLSTHGSKSDNNIYNKYIENM